MTRVPTLLALLLPVVTLLLLAGCGTAPEKSAGDSDEHATSDSHDEHASDVDHDAPASLAEGVTELKENYEAIKTAFASGKLDDIHTPLHKVAPLLEALPKLADSADLSDEQATSAKEAISQMFDAYSQVDGALHDGKEADYSAVSDTLDQAMAALESAVAQ